jgi:hypothetical protein
VSVFKLEEEFCTLVLIAVDELLVLDWIGASLHEASILTSL